MAVAPPSTSHALACREDGTGSIITQEALGTALAVAADAPNGSIIWESGPRSTNVICKDDYNYGREEIYFYVNPANVSIGTGIRVGIRYNNQPITQSTGKVGTGFFSDRGCNLANCKGWDKARFTLNFSVFIEKYDPTPPSGQASTLTEYRVFQLDGVRGLNSRPNSNFNYVVTGMNGIRFVPCTPELTISPSVVSFPILGNIRYLVEGIRPEIRQYLLESDSDALPFSRPQRDQLRRLVELEKPAHPLRHVDQHIRRIPGNLVLRQRRLHHLETLVDQVQQRRRPHVVDDERPGRRLRRASLFRRRGRLLGFGFRRVQPRVDVRRFGLQGFLFQLHQLLGLLAPKRQVRTQ